MSQLALESLQPTVAAIYQTHVVAAEDWRRPHLGASQIGKPCSRALWYGFRWAQAPDFDGRMRRLFRRGEREEAEFVRELRAAGVEVHDCNRETGKQFRFAVLGGHVGGSMDAAALGVPEAPRTWHVCEFKTSNAKGFAKLQKEGVQKAKPEHFSQMMLYMHWSGMTRALYLAVNKDTDELYSERVRYVEHLAERLMKKAEAIAFADVPPPGVSTDPTRFECKFCDYRELCFKGRLPEVNCRTCAHATPEREGDARWSCVKAPGESLDVEMQRLGCCSHRYIPALVTFAELVGGDNDENWVEYRLPDGRTFRNAALPDGYASTELRVTDFTKLMGDDHVEALRHQMGGRLAGPDELPRDDQRAIVTSYQGLKPPHPTTAGKDWGWQVFKKKQEAVS